MELRKVAAVSKPEVVIITNTVRIRQLRLGGENERLLAQGRDREVIRPTSRIGIGEKFFDGRYQRGRWEKPSDLFSMIKKEV